MEIRIYVEGGGDGKETKRQMRQGFSEFFTELVADARDKRIRWNIIACGGRQSTYDNFILALRTHPDAFNVLLVDSEDPVSSLTWEHLAARDKWPTDRLLNEQYHLMVQVMEAWFIADIDNLGRFYGNGFNINSIPRRHDVEQIDKVTLYNALATATRNTRKGAYHEIQHGAKLLGLINPLIVRRAAPHCERLFNTLHNKMQQNDTNN